jgi:hypothetical protein
MNNRKVLMSLVTASISALAAAPALAENIQKQQENPTQQNQTDHLIDISNFIKATATLTPEQFAFQQDVHEQVQSMLTKKNPLIKIGETFSIVADNYGKDKVSMKQKIFKDMNLAYGGTNDSTNVANTPAYYNNAQSSCFSTCHSACHGACHGARGWR